MILNNPMSVLVRPEADFVISKENSIFVIASSDIIKSLLNETIFNQKWQKTKSTTFDNTWVSSCPTTIPIAP